MVLINHCGGFLDLQAENFVSKNPLQGVSRSLAVNADAAVWERKKESMKIGHIVQLRKYSVVRFA